MNQNEAVTDAAKDVIGKKKKKKRNWFNPTYEEAVKEEKQEKDG